MTQQAPQVRAFTMNPAVDVFATTEQLYTDSKSRCQQAMLEPGGGGINVARNLHRLGIAAEVIFPAGGPHGEVLQGLLDDQQLPYTAVPIAGQTRQNFAVTETRSGQMHHFVFPGPELHHDELAALQRVLLAEPLPEYLVLSGSIPDKVPAEFYGQLTQTAAERGAKVILDASGPALTGSLYRGAYLAKLNRSEFTSLGYPEQCELTELVQAMQQEVSRQAVQVLIVTLRRGGAVMVDQGAQALFMLPPDAPLVSHVGAGDAFVSALVWQLCQGAELSTAFRYGIAGATTTLQSQGNQLTDFALLEQVAASTNTPANFTGQV